MNKGILFLLLWVSCFFSFLNSNAQSNYKMTGEVRLKEGVNGHGFGVFDGPEGEIIVIGNFVDSLKLKADKSAVLPPSEKYLAIAWKISKKGRLVWEKAYPGYTFIKVNNFNPLRVEPPDREIYLCDLTKKEEGENPRFPVFKLLTSGQVLPDQAGWFDGYDFKLLNADSADIFVSGTNDHYFGYGPDTYAIKKTVKNKEIWSFPLGDSISKSPELIQLRNGGAVVAFSAGKRNTGAEKEASPHVEYTGYRDHEFSESSQYLIKLDASGNKVWQKIIGKGNGKIERIDLANDNVFYLKGSTEKIIKVPCDPENGNEADCFDANTSYWVKKADLAGNILWQQISKPGEDLWQVLDDGGALFRELVPGIGRDSLIKSLAFTLLNAKGKKQWTYRCGQAKVCYPLKVYANGDLLFHSRTLVKNPLERPFKVAAISNSLVRVNAEGKSKSIYETGEDFLDLNNVFSSETGDFILIGEPQLVKNKKGVLEKRGYVLCQRIKKKKL